MGATVGANSIYRQVLGPEWTPTAEEWKLITLDKSPEGSFSIAGNLEYCDWWGKYHCEWFDIDYRPAPVGSFTARMRECSGGFPPRRPNAIPGDPEFTVTPLPRCEQPQERAAREEQVQ